MLYAFTTERGGGGRGRGRRGEEKDEEKEEEEKEEAEKMGPELSEGILRTRHNFGASMMETPS